MIRTLCFLGLVLLSCVGCGNYTVVARVPEKAEKITVTCYKDGKLQYKNSELEYVVLVGDKSFDKCEVINADNTSGH